MKVTFDKIKVENFRQIAKREFAFGSSANCIISKNGAGKTNLLHAITWCLFGKDMDDRAKFEVVPLNPDNTRTEQEPDVALELTIDGSRRELRRQLKGGKTAQTYIDGAPCKTLKEFDAFVAEVFDTPERFKMYTNPLYFPESHWQEQRQTFMQFFPLPDNSSVFAYMEKNKITARTFLSAGLGDKEPDKMQARYQLAQKEMDAERDKIRAQIELLDEQLDGQQLFDETATRQERGVLRAKVNAIQAIVQTISAKNADAASKRYELQGYLDAAEHKLNFVEQEEKLKHSAAIAAAESALERAQSVINRLRDDYKELAPVSEICDKCGQTLPQEIVAELRQTLQNRRDGIVQKGNQSKTEVEKIEAELRHLRGTPPSVDQAKTQEIKQKITQTRERLNTLPLQEEVPTIDSETLERLEELDKLLARSDVYAENKERRTKLMERERKISKEYEDAEKVLLDIADFLFYRSEMIVKAVNKEFKCISVKVLEIQKNGTAKETFEILKNGVPYSELNTAGQLEAGLELVNFLKSKLEITCPVLIDNGERYTDVNFGTVKGQLICAIAVKAQELTVINALPGQIDPEIIQESAKEREDSIDGKQ